MGASRSNGSLRLRVGLSDNRNYYKYFLFDHWDFKYMNSNKCRSHNSMFVKLNSMAFMLIIAWLPEDQKYNFHPEKHLVSFLGGLL